MELIWQFGSFILHFMMFKYVERPRFSNQDFFINILFLQVLDYLCCFTISQVSHL